MIALSLALATASLFAPASSTAPALQQGVILYEVTSQGLGAEAFTQGASVEVRFRGGQVRLDAQALGGTLKWHLISDETSNKALLLSELGFFGGNTALWLNWADYQKQNEEALEEFTFVPSNEQLQLAGQVCTRQSHQFESGTRLDLWTCPPPDDYMSRFISRFFGDIKGIPMLMRVNFASGAFFECKAKKFLFENQEKKLFEQTIPKGYELIEEEEYARRMERMKF
jgi:hypothetical protein